MKHSQIGAPRMLFCPSCIVFPGSRHATGLLEKREKSALGLMMSRTGQRLARGPFSNLYAGMVAWGMILAALMTVNLCRGQQIDVNLTETNFGRGTFSFNGNLPSLSSLQTANSGAWGNLNVFPVTFLTLEPTIQSSFFTGRGANFNFNTLSTSTSGPVLASSLSGSNLVGQAFTGTHDFILNGDVLSGDSFDLAVVPGGGFMYFHYFFDPTGNGGPVSGTGIFDDLSVDGFFLGREFAEDVEGIPTEWSWGIPGLTFNYSLDLLARENRPPLIDLAQLFNSAIPMNQAIGQVASSIHNTGVRDFSGRLFRIRNRYEPAGGIARGNDFFQRRSREVAASRFFRMQRELDLDTTINLNGVDRNTPSQTADQFESAIIDDDNPFLSVTHEARCNLPAGCLAAGDNWLVWAQADFGNVELDNLGGNPGLESNTRAASVGLEYGVNDHLNLGAGWSHLWNETDFVTGIGGADIEGDLGVVYGTYFRDNLWTDLMYSYGNYKADIHRNTGAGTTVRAEPDIDTHRGDFNIGYNFGLSGGDIVHGPTFRTSYTNGTLHGYTETGDPLRNTTFADQDFESLVTTPGWQVNWKMETNYGMIRPQFRVGYGQEHLDQDQAITATYQNLIYTRNQHDPGESWLDLGAGVAFDINRSLSLIFDYNGQFLRDDAQVHYGSVKAALKW